MFHNSILQMAFLGDSIYETLIRKKLCQTTKYPVKKLNKMKLNYVTASAQAIALDKIMDILSEEEKDIVIKGRNAKTTNVPKTATHSEYHSATALETLFGYLYLKENYNRLNELIDIIFNEEKGNEI
ncbi:MAG: ribonuclease III domain-containing protein [Clostridia bacterium]|nr:ribonuclease III domain-containing protein [Clostridia bacterium]